MIPQCICVMDRSIMNHVNQHCNNTKELERFNIIRIWLRVYSLAEITTADGTSIKRISWKAQRLFSLNILWPYQEEPNDISKRTWRRLLSHTFLLNHNNCCTSIITKDLLLTSPLKEWNSPSEWFQKQWKTFYSRSTQKLYIQTSTNFSNVHYRIHHSCRQLCPIKFRNMLFTISTESTTFTCPDDSSPIDIHPEDQFIRTNISWQILSPISLQSPTTWTEYVSLLPD